MRQTGLCNQDISIDTADFHRQSLGSIPVQFVWYLWWEIWNLGRKLSQFHSFFL